MADFVSSFFGYNWDARWYTILAQIGFCFFFFATSTLALRKINWQNR